MVHWNAEQVEADLGGALSDKFAYYVTTVFCVHHFG